MAAASRLPGKTRSSGAGGAALESLDWELDFGPELVTLVLRGEMDVSATETATTAIDALRETTTHVVIDLTDVSFVDGHGLDALMRLADLLTKAGISVAYGGRHRRVERYLDLTGRSLDETPSAGVAANA